MRGPALDELIASAVRRLKSGASVEEATRVLADRLRPRLLSYFRRRRFSESEVEDLTQETLRRLFAGIGGLVNEASFPAWLFQIARNVATTARAAPAPPHESLDGPAGTADVPDTSRPTALETLLSAERLDRIRAAIEALPPQQRRCLLLRVVHEMSYEEIAIVLQVSVRTVRNHLLEARRRLRRSVPDR